MKQNNLTREEMKVILQSYLKDKICVKAVMDTLDDNQLNKYIKNNKVELKC